MKGVEGYYKLKGGVIINLILLSLVSILPGILWVWYFYRQDKYDPEPTNLIIRDFLWGIVIVLPASLLESPFGGYVTPQTPLLILFLSTIFVVGLVEEGLKSYTVYRLHYNHPDFDEPVDGIIYGVTVGLGFAAFENLVYATLFGLSVGLSRAVLTSLAHASFTGIFGYYLSKAKEKQDRSLIWFGFVLVTFFHGLYDFLVIGGFITTFYTIIIIVALQLYLASLIRNTTERSPFK
ncbi:MAG: PrsW family intramembrane metalloprotease [Firmicutes bacterium]|nr:PrsW family intramembrane metalloprotease [Bacillota bacterium]